MLEIIQNIDESILFFIQNNIRNPILDKLMVFITTLGNAGAIWLLISILLMLNKRFIKIGFMASMAYMLTAILGEGVLKNVIQRGRPFESMKGIELLISKPSSFSFPSGHTGFSFAATGVLAKYFRKYRIPLFILASLMAFSRVYLCVHYPSDIIGGIILGLICSQISIWVFDRESESAGISM